MLGDTLQIVQTSYKLLVKGVKDYAIIILDDRGHIVSGIEVPNKLKDIDLFFILRLLFLLN
jgi:hypothetical protein